MMVYRRAQRRREEIQQAAYLLFTEQGFQSTTMDQIASKVKIARTTLYEYYRSKDDILYSLIDDVVEESRSRTPIGTVREQVEMLAEESITRLQKNVTLYKIMFQELPLLSQPAAERLRDWQQKSLEFARRAIREGLAKGEFADGLEEEDICFVYRSLIGQRMSDLLMLDIKANPVVEARRLVELMWFGVGYGASQKEESHDKQI